MSGDMSVERAKQLRADAGPLLNEVFAALDATRVELKDARDDLQADDELVAQQNETIARLQDALTEIYGIAKPMDYLGGRWEEIRSTSSRALSLEKALAEQDGGGQ